MEEILSQILQKNLKISPKGLTPRLKLTKLQGDASYRIYYRLQVEGGRSFIVMQLPAGKSSASEEITNLKEKPQELPFINIAKDLKNKGLPVPEIFHYEKEAGLLLLEDFGDETLEKRLQISSPKEQDHWYEKAIDLLILFQQKCRQKSKGIAYQRSFDTTLLQWEFDHFIEYGIEVRQNMKVSEEDLKEIRRGTNFITFALTKLPQILVHRDFQSRNLMIHEESLKLLDFQDALLGPQPYDLVALLRDSYIQLPWERAHRLIDYYLSYLSNDEDKAKADKNLFCKMFDWMTIQRKLKDAGRFVYIDRVKKNPSFLKHIPASLSYVREAFERQSELKNLYEVLKKYVPEFN